MTAINNTVKTTAPDYASLLEDALNGPAEQLASFRVFHRYSAANRQLAAQQLRIRGIPLSPLSTFKHWQSQGINVMKGQKAISLFMPVTKKEEVERNGEVVEETKSFFVMRPNWFALAQTDGWNDGQADLSVPEGIDWNPERCLAALGIEVEAFDNSIALDGNCGGYAYRDQNVIALNPLWGNPLAVLAHEVAHKLLHSAGTVGAEYSAAAKEVEAECTAFIVASSLGILSEAEAKGSRDYIAKWSQDYVGWSAKKVQDEHARRIFGAVDKILKAGLPAKESVC